MSLVNAPQAGKPAAGAQGKYTERDGLRYFRKLVAGGAVFEQRGERSIVVECDHCSAMWHRYKDDGRKLTVAHRLAVVSHVRTVHPITWKAHVGGGDE